MTILGQDYVYHISQDYSTSTSAESYSYVHAWIQSTNDNYLNGPDVTQNINYTADSNDFVGGYFQFYDYDSTSGTYEKYAYGNLTPSNVTVSVSAVPEQSTWAMMITAFGFAGAAFRRRGSSQNRRELLPA